MEISIGAYSLPVILSIILAIIYKVVPSIPDRFKALMAIGCGIVLGLLAMIYGTDTYTAKVIINYAIAGLMAGAAAVGLYETQRIVKKPRK